MAFAHFSSRKNLAVDLGLSVLISLIMHFLVDKESYETAETVGILMGRIVGIFCLFFIWSWKSKYILNDRLVRNCLHVICIFMLSIASFWVWFSMIYELGFPTLIMILVWGSGVAIKYKRLFWPKDQLKNATDDLEPGIETKT